VSVKSNLIVEGFVRRSSTRSGVKDGNAWSMTNCLILGDDCLVDATIGRGLEVPPDGTFVRGVVEVGVFGGDDSPTVTKWLNWDKPAAAKS